MRADGRPGTAAQTSETRLVINADRCFARWLVDPLSTVAALDDANSISLTALQEIEADGIAITGLAASLESVGFGGRPVLCHGDGFGRWPESLWLLMEYEGRSNGASRCSQRCFSVGGLLDTFCGVHRLKRPRRTISRLTSRCTGRRVSLTGHRRRFYDYGRRRRVDERLGGCSLKD